MFISKGFLLERGEDSQCSRTALEEQIALTLISNKYLVRRVKYTRGSISTLECYNAQKPGVV